LELVCRFQPSLGATDPWAANESLPGAVRVWEKGAGKIEESAMWSRILVTGLALLLTGCGSGTGRLSGGAAGGAATGALIGLVGGPIGVVVGAGIGAGAGAMTSSNTTPKQVDLGPPPWSQGRTQAEAQPVQVQPTTQAEQAQAAQAQPIQPQADAGQPIQLQPDAAQPVQAQPLPSPR
jgi:hypothetical protein